MEFNIVLDTINIILWFSIGIFVLTTGNVSLIIFFCAWALLMLHFIIALWDDMEDTDNEES